MFWKLTCLWLAVAILPRLVIAADSINLLSNGSFEAQLGGWQASTDDRNQVGTAAEVDTTRAKHGSNSLRLTLPGPSSATVVSPMAPVAAGKDYLLTFWYRSEGFSASGDFAGVNLQYVLQWLDVDRQGVGNDSMGLSYGAVPDWQFMVRMFRAPRGAAFVTVSYVMSVIDQGRPSRFWLDDVRWRPWPGEPQPGGKTWTFHVADGTYQQDLFRRVADDDTPTGFAVLANPRFGQKPGYLAGNLYTRLLAPGQYRAVFRLKVAEIPAESVVLLHWDLNTDSRGFLGAGSFESSNFDRAGAYQDLVVRFVVPPGIAWVDPRISWMGKVGTWIDTITIVEERTFTGEDLTVLTQ